MKIGVDRAQQKGKHEMKHAMLREMGHDLVSLPLPVGDYVRITPEMEEVIERRGSKLKKIDLLGLIDHVSVDTKRDMQELYGCLVTNHQRFSDECRLACDNGIRLIILVENRDGITCVDETGRWRNASGWRTYSIKRRKGVNCRPPAAPSTLKKIMWTMKQKYGTEFRFCRPEETASVIASLLSDANKKNEKSFVL